MAKSTLNRSMALFATGALLFAGVLMLRSAAPAEAFSSYATATGQACGVCHVDPGGGGPLTAKGLAFKAISTHSTDPAGAWAQISAPPAPTATRVPPTATKVPPTATRVPPAATAVPPTATRVPPTATTVPPTATMVPPTAVPPTAVPPTAVPPKAVPPVIVESISVPPTPIPTASPAPRVGDDDEEADDAENEHEHDSRPWRHQDGRNLWQSLRPED